MLCKKKSKGINAKTAAARARKAATEAEKMDREAWEQEEAAWIASCPSPLKPSKAARRKEETLARRSEALCKKAEAKQLALEEQKKLELLYHTGHKERKCRPGQRIHVSNTCEEGTTDQSAGRHQEKGSSAFQSRIVVVGTQDYLQHRKDQAYSDDSLKKTRSRPYATHPSIPIHPQRPSRKTLYQASFLYEDY